MKTTIPSPNTNNSSCCSLSKENNCSLSSNTDSSSQFTGETDSENSNQHTIVQIRICYKLMCTALFPCMYVQLKYTLTPPGIPFLLDLRSQLLLTTEFSLQSAETISNTRPHGAVLTILHLMELLTKNRTGLKVIC